MTTNVVSAAPQSLLDVVKKAANGFFEYMIRFQQARAAAAAYQALESMTDAQLARQGIERADISKIVVGRLTS